MITRARAASMTQHMVIRVMHFFEWTMRELFGVGVVVWYSAQIVSGVFCDSQCVY